MRKLLFILLLLIPFWVSAQQVGGAGHDNGWYLEDTIYSSPVIEGDLFVTGVTNIETPHGTILFSDSTTTIAVAQDTWTQITNVTDNLFHVEDTFRVDYLAGDTVEIMEEGHYIVLGNLSWSGNNGEFWKIAIFKNGSIIGAASERYTSNNDTGNASTVPLMTALTVGDKLIFMIYNDTDGDDPTVRSGGITIHKMGTQ